ncbi:MAG: Flp family type IVb pilin [Desulfobulbaceae bacterium]|nr:Flp family type IVb pilin [Desulfobulbaceae bacterium]
MKALELKVLELYLKTKSLLKNEEGVTAIEYGLIAALVAIVIIAGAALLGTNLNLIFERIAGVVAGNTPDAPAAP